MESVKGIIDKYGLANVNDKVNGVTALHSAVAKGSLEMVKLLIENGASPNEKIGKTLDTDNDDLYELYHNIITLIFQISSYHIHLFLWKNPCLQVYWVICAQLCV